MSRNFYGPLDKEDTIVRSIVIISTSHLQSLLLKPTIDTKHHDEETYSASLKFLPTSYEDSETRPELKT